MILRDVFIFIILLNYSTSIITAISVGIIAVMTIKNIVDSTNQYYDNKERNNEIIENYKANIDKNLNKAKMIVEMEKKIAELRIEIPRLKYEYLSLEEEEEIKIKTFKLKKLKKEKIEEKYSDENMIHAYFFDLKKEKYDLIIKMLNELNELEKEYNAYKNKI